MQLWRALRVPSARGGAQRRPGLEPPFVGRDRELRIVKELFHATAEEGKAHLVSVTGIAGIGKSRLAWEFEKYMDGLVDEVWWHRGRCLAYGEGVAYWALAEMVRMRARDRRGRGDHEPALREARAPRRASTSPTPRSARGSSRGSPTCSGSASARRRAAGPVRRVAALLRAAGRRRSRRARLRGHPVGRRGAARLRRVPARVVAQLSDLRAHPRPAGAAERRPTWGGGHATSTRSSSSRSRRGDGGAARRPRARPSRRAPRRRSSPGPKASRSTRSRPCGCCSTVACSPARATFTARPGRSRRSTSRRRCTRCIAARLDGLTPEERRARRRTPPCSGRRSRSRALAALVRARRGRRRAAPRDARPQGGPLASRPTRARPSAASTASSRICCKVAYETLSKTDRKARHLAAARHISSAWADEEIVEIVAAHYLEAFRPSPTPTTRPSSRAWPGTRSPAPASGQRRSRRPTRPPVLRPGRRARRRPARGGAAARAGRALGPQRRRHGGRPARAGTLERALCGSRGDTRGGARRG